jgi:SAM-dependent methyltransferase
MKKGNGYLLNRLFRTSRRIGTRHTKSQEIELVRTAYQLLLGRDPENNSVIQDKLGMSAIELREDFTQSYEFLIRNRVPLTPSLNLIKSPSVSKEIIDGYFLKLVNQWTSLGNSNPYWSVLSSDEYRGNLSGDNLEDFYNSGQEVLSRFHDILKTFEIDPNPSHTILELGCGVGRITKSLAEKYNRVIALDVSPGNLEIARNKLKSFSNIEFIQLEDVESIVNMQTISDHMITVITLQHNPPEVQNILLSSLLSKTKSFAFFQTVTHIEKISNSQGPDQDLLFDTFVMPMREILSCLRESNFELLEIYRDDFQLDPNFHSYSFLAKRTYLNSSM